MADYIDRDALLAAVEERNRNTCNAPLHCLQLKKIVENITAAEVAP